MNVTDYIRGVRHVRGAFRRCFNGPEGKPHADGRTALSELKRFCYAAKPTVKQAKDGRIDPLAMAVAEGRREVYLRIMALLDLDDRDLVRMERMMKAEEADG